MTESAASRDVVSPLQATQRALDQLFDVALLDLDGVVYRGHDPVAHAAPALAQARQSGMRLSFVTNNALRPPEEVARRIAAAGVEADPADVATSAQAAARLLAEQLPAGGRVLVAGGEGLRLAVRERGLVPVSQAEENPLAVVSGYDPELTYARLAEAVLAIFAGALWIASNMDVTVPTERGLLPGAGATVAFIAAATRATPQVAGKPERALHEEATSRSGAKHPLVVGDRLDTDIEGANGVGAPSLLVLTGVATLEELVTAAPHLRPTYLADDLRGLLRPASGVTVEGATARCGAWTCREQDGVLAWNGEGAEGDDGLDAFRAGVSLAWSLGDSGRELAGTSGSVPARCEVFSRGGRASEHPA
ncbi:MAG TPA: HAD-IIA family hydrolase [Frankiaceae bacterium]|jgi:HAD superfamily hydrolase (TIGR01450 family)|nr:HAD-IIA family hydrolase [Frankiaceae bacterium]